MENRRATVPPWRWESVRRSAPKAARWLVSVRVAESGEVLRPAPGGPTPGSAGPGAIAVPADQTGQSIRCETLGGRLARQDDPVCEALVRGGAAQAGHRARFVRPITWRCTKVDPPALRRGLRVGRVARPSGRPLGGASLVGFATPGFLIFVHQLAEVHQRMEAEQPVLPERAE